MVHLTRALPAIFLLTIAASLAAADDAAPFGLQRRVPWTTSRLVGSPEPPLPYTVEKIFPRLELKSPMYVVAEPASDDLWVVLRNEGQEPSRVVRFKNDADVAKYDVLLEIPQRLVYALCFDPQYATNHQIYLFSNGPTPEPERVNRVSRYTVATSDTAGGSSIDPKSEQAIIEWKSSGHDGGDLGFALDGTLFITTGDGTSDSDTNDVGQTIDDLLGAVLRIDVHKPDGDRSYSVPADNPFVNTPGARGEIWAYGLRNPWRMAVDPKTGHLWVGNNGQDQWETAHLVRPGENYGWSVYEGSHPFYLHRKRGPTPPVAPTIEHSHAEFRSLTGGVVYHGAELPELDGAYIYGDYSSGRIWGMRHDGQRVIWHRELADTSLGLVAFQVDQRGRMLVVDLASGIYRLVPTPKSEPTPPFPTRLSETGLLTSTPEHRPAPGVIPYSVNAAGWNDGASADRFLALPGDGKIAYHSGRSWDFPDGSALVQTLSLERQPGNADSRFRVETRVLLRQQGEWAGYSYRWNDEQSDAMLVAREGADEQLAIDGPGGTRQQPWRVPSRADCMMCHSRAASYLLGLSEAQLNRVHDYDGVADNQLRALDHIELFKERLAKPPVELTRLADPRDTSADLESRVRSYLHVNCSVCHVSAGGGNAKMELAVTQARDKMSLLGARPQHDTFGIANAMLVAPAAPDRSVVLHRLSRRGRGQMPPLGTSVVDEAAVQLVRDWIAGLKPDRPFVRAWQMDDLLSEATALSAERAAAGKTLFRETGCAECHRLGSEGGTVGPDLTGIAKRQKPHEVLESILLPSKTIADQYATYAIETADGQVISGLIEREDQQRIVVRPTSDLGKSIEIELANVAERHRLTKSNMPDGIVNVLEKEQILDLLAFVISGADTPAKP